MSAVKPIAAPNRIFDFSETTKTTTANEIKDIMVKSLIRLGGSMKIGHFFAVAANSSMVIPCLVKRDRGGYCCVICDESWFERAERI